MADGLQGPWQVNFDAWRLRFDPFFQQIASVRLNILVWGPGESSPDYPKREQICRHLSAGSVYNNVATSEQLIRAEERFQGMHAYEAEQIQWLGSDIVLVVITADPRSSGARTETALFRGERRFREKAWLIVPRLSAKQRKRIAFLDQGWALFPAERQYRYTREQFQDCSQIRDFCAGVVEELRQERGFEQIRRLSLSD